MITIKVFGYLGIFSFFVNNFISNATLNLHSLDGLISGFGSKFVTSDNYLGVCFDLIIRFIFSFNINDMSNFVRMFGVK